MADLNYLVNFDANTRGLDTARQGVDALTTALATLGIGFGLKELAEVADAYNTLSARIAVAVGETGNVQEAMEGVQRVALETTSSLEATSQLFSKIHDVGKSMGLTQQQSLDLTKTINQAISLSGGSAQAAEASITQLSQALASGVLRGDEFNSVNEQAPEIMKALANSLNVTTGELRKMAEEGKLSSQVVINGLQSQADVIQEKYSKFPTTIAQAMQNIKTQWEIVVGEFDTENGASAVVVKALQTIGDNLSWIKNIFNDVGKGVSWFSDKLSQVDDSTINELKTTLSLAYDTVKDLAKSIGEMGETAWNAFKSVLDSVSPVFGAFTAGQKEVSSLDTALRSLQVGLGLISDGATGLSIVLNGLVAGLQFVAGGFATLQAKVANFLGFEDVAKQAELASERLFKSAEQSLKRADELAQNFQSKARQAIEEINKTEEQKNTESVAKHKQTLDDKIQQLSDFVLKERDFVGERIELEKQLQTAKQTEDTKTVEQITKNIADIESKQAESAKTQQKLEKEKHEAIVAYAEQAIKANNSVISDQLLLELATQNYIATVDEAGKVSVKAWEYTAKASEKAGLSLKDSALNSAKGLGVDVKLALNEINSAFQANIEQVHQVAKGYDELRQAGMNASSLIKASLDKLLEGAKSQKEIDTVRQMFVQFGVEGKLSTNQVESGLEAINEKLNKTPELLDETARAFKELGIISQAEAEKQAKKQIEMFELVKNSGQASSEQLQQALLKVQKSIETSGNSSQQSWLSSQQSALGLNKALEQTAQVSERVASSASQIGDGVAVGVAHGISELDKLNAKLTETEQRSRAIAEQREKNNLAVAKSSQKDVNQYTSRSAVENFYQQAGLGDKQIKQLLGNLKLKNNGMVDWNATRGYTAGQPIGSDYQSVSSWLLKQAESMKYSQKSTLTSPPKPEPVTEKQPVEKVEKPVVQTATIKSTGQAISITAPNAGELAKTINQLIAEAEKRATEKATTNFMNQLQSELKRQAR